MHLSDEDKEYINSAHFFLKIANTLEDTSNPIYSYNIVQVSTLKTYSENKKSHKDKKWEIYT